MGRFPLISFQLSPGIVAAHHVPVFLHKEHARPRAVHGDMVNAVADLGIGIGNILRTESSIYRLPRLAAVVGTECAGGRDGDEDSLRIAGIENDGVQAHAASARLPLRTSAVTAQAGKFLPVLSAIGGAENGGVLHARVHRVGFGERRLDVPHALELPRMLRTVVPLMRGQGLSGCVGCVVDELVADELSEGRGREFLRGAFRADARSCRRHRSAE